VPVDPAPHSNGNKRHEASNDTFYEYEYEYDVNAPA